MPLLSGVYATRQIHDTARIQDYNKETHSKTLFSRRPHNSKQINKDQNISMSLIFLLKSLQSIGNSLFNLFLSSPENKV